MLKKHIILSTFLFVFSILINENSKAALAEGTNGNINVIVGQKELDDSDWGNLDNQFLLGFASNWHRQNWPVSVAFDVLASGDESDSRGADVEGQTLEFNFGIRKVFRLGNGLLPYFGGGPGLIWAEQETNHPVFGLRSDSGSTLGLWVNGGLMLELTEAFLVGFDVRMTAGEVEIFDNDVDAGGTHIGLLAGYQW